MEKFFRLLYYYTLGIFVAAVVYLTLAMYFSPRQDALKRGFIPCTEQLVAELNYCARGTIKCPMQLMLRDTKCNMDVVLSGLGLWLKGKQKTPWENYWFAAVDSLPAEITTNSANNLALDEEFMARKQEELDLAKQRYFNLSEKVLISNPETAEKIPFVQPIDETNLEIEAGNISEEAFLDNITANETVAEPSAVTDHMLKRKKLRQINNDKIKGTQNDK